MYEQITREQFEEIAERLEGGIWLKVFCDTVSVDVFYPDFEFLKFVNNTYQFGHKQYDEENSYQNVLIESEDILDIHRCSLAPTVNAEQLILTMIDVQIILETENC